MRLKPQDSPNPEFRLGSQHSESCTTPAPPETTFLQSLTPVPLPALCPLRPSPRVWWSRTCSSTHLQGHRNASPIFKTALPPPQPSGRGPLHSGAPWTAPEGASGAFSPWSEALGTHPQPRASSVLRGVPERLHPTAAATPMTAPQGLVLRHSLPHLGKQVSLLPHLSEALRSEATYS